MWDNYTITKFIKYNSCYVRYLLRFEFGDRYILFNSDGDLIFDVFGIDGRINALFSSHKQCESITADSLDKQILDKILNYLSNIK